MCCHLSVGLSSLVEVNLSKIGFTTNAQTRGQILTKLEQVLRNIMKPNTWKQIEEYMYRAGFKDVQPFWRNHMFVGAIAVK